MEILAFLGLVCVLAAIIVAKGVHSIHEGHVGVYWRAGALKPEVTEPGMHWMMPLLDNYAELQVTLQTDYVSNIPCGTSSGVVITFGRIEVVNRLRKSLAHETVANYTTSYDKLWIFDKVHHEINQFCSSHTLNEVVISHFSDIDEILAERLKVDCQEYAPGIEIIAVRVTKPEIPEKIRREFDLREANAAALLVAEQRRKVVEAESATEAKKLEIEAKRDADVAAINSQKEVAQQKAEQEKEAIRDSIHLAHEKAIADAEGYKLEKLAEVNNLLLSPKYLQLKMYESIAQNTKVYFGEKIPTYLGNLAHGDVP